MIGTCIRASDFEFLSIAENEFLAFARAIYLKFFSAFVHQSARTFHHGIDHCIVMVRVMMKKEKPADFGVERERDSAGN
jgi:hypothetical protein